MRRIALAATLLVALAGCGASSDSGSSEGGGAPADSAPRDGAAKPASDGSGLTAVAVGRAQIRTAAMTVRVDDVAVAARSAVRIAEGRGGFLESEQTSDESTTLTVRVPPEDFTATSDALAALGAVTERTVSTEDVTSDVADVEGRLKAARASVGRVRDLLGRATTIAEITDLEAELNEREAALESLETRRRSLAGQTAFAALTATFNRPVLAAPKPKAAEPGFGGGLRAGWGVFRTTVAVLLVVLGAVLPFAVLALLVGVPLYVVRRRVSARA